MEQLHARDNGTDEVDVKNRIYIDEVEDHGNGQESEPGKVSHGDGSRRRIGRAASVVWPRVSSVE